MICGMLGFSLGFMDRSVFIFGLRVYEGWGVYRSCWCVRGSLDVEIGLWVYVGFGMFIYVGVVMV